MATTGQKRSHSDEDESSEIEDVDEDALLTINEADDVSGELNFAALQLSDEEPDESTEDTDQTLQDEDLQANGDDVRLNESNKGNKLTVSDTVEVIRPVDVDVEIVQTKSDMPDQLNHRNKPITETQRRKRQKVTQEMVWEAQIQFFREQTATERRRRQLMDVKEKFYTAATKALQDKEISDIMDILNSNTEP